METKIIPLQQCYLSILCEIAESAGYQTLQHEQTNNVGTLWFTRKETTVPGAWMRYQFDDANCSFKVQTRDDRLDGTYAADVTVGYREGLDDFAMRFSKMLTANRLQHVA